MPAPFGVQGVAFVTGAAHGIGQGAAFALAAAGASTVIFADVDAAGAKTAAERSIQFATHDSYTSKAVHLDVTDFEQVEKAMKEVALTFGKIDYLINSAGVDVNQYSPLPEVDLADFDRVLAVNMRGMLNCTKAAIAIMEHQEPTQYQSTRGESRSLGRGVIVNVTSALSYAAVPGKVAYITSKHAALGVTKATAQDCAGKQIRVNAICPSWVRTPMFTSECNKFPPIVDFIKAAAPAGRPAEADEVGDSVVYLCSPAASYVNGIGLILDSGLTLTVHMGI